MDYETPDGSQFSLREVWEYAGAEQQPKVAYISVTAFVDGQAYAGRLKKALELIDEYEAMECLQQVPAECIHPACPDDLTKEGTIDRQKHYLKAPSFLREDCQPGATLVADCLINEAYTLEYLKNHPHPNLAKYHGCVVQDGRITQLCPERYAMNLADYVGSEDQPTSEQLHRILEDVKAGLEHLHSLGLAHNDINMNNICLDHARQAIIVDFDSCCPFGKTLLKGSGKPRYAREHVPVSDPGNDICGLHRLAQDLGLESKPAKCSPQEPGDVRKHLAGLDPSVS